MIQLEKEALIDLANQKAKEEPWFVEGFEIDDAEVVGNHLVLRSSQMLSLPKQRWDDFQRFATEMSSQYTLL